jgi:hypothetical protein
MDCRQLDLHVCENHESASGGTSDGYGESNININKVMFYSLYQVSAPLGLADWGKPGGEHPVK